MNLLGQKGTEVIRRQLSVNILAICMLILSVLPVYASSDFNTQIKDIGMKYGLKSLGRIRIKASADKIKQQAGNIIANQAQSLLMLWVLSGVDIVRQQIEIAGLTRETVQPGQLLSLSGQAAESIINSGDIWASLAGGGVASELSAKPLQILNAFIASKVSRPILKGLLQNGITTVVTFVGWEMGGELYREATDLLEDTTEYERAQQFGSMFLSSLLNSRTDESIQDKAIIKKIFTNMWLILSQDDELRNLWLYNTWRNHIATGDFVSIVSSMVAGTTIGTALFPGAGSVAGLMFGVAGGTLSIFIPESSKNEITNSFQNGREMFWHFGLDSKNTLNDSRAKVIQIVGERIKNQEAMPPMLRFPKTYKAHDAMVTIYFERLFKANSNLELTKAKIELAINSKNSASLPTLYAQKLQLETETKEALAQMQVFFRSQEDYLVSAIKDAGLEQSNSSSLRAKYSILNDIFIDLDETQKINGFISYFSDEMAAQTVSEDASRALQRFYYFGFSRENILSFIN